jgi:outer membrane protein assembly factor BamB
MSNIPAPVARKPLRLWPGVVVVALQSLVWLIAPVAVPGGMMYAVVGGLVGGLLVLLWWLFFSRAPWPDRLGAIVLMAAALFAISFVIHQSISNGMMGMMLPIFAVPALSLALVGSAAATRRLPPARRRASMAAAIAAACALFTLLRTGGITGEGDSDLHWRWTQTPEERLLATGGDLPAATSTPPVSGAPATTPLEPSPSPVVATAAERPSDHVADEAATERPAPSATFVHAEWPGFRGPERDDSVRGVRIATDWAASPPVELWRRPIGPGWSSFAVQGNLLYTQEQRADDEIVAAYNLTTGAPVWGHRDPARFYESNGGPGPRATPTLSGGRVYTFGATGIVNALDARTGAVIWSRNASSDTGTPVPDWGFAGSPLVVGDLVAVAAAGSLVAYDAATGKPRWFGPKGGGGYSSPHLATIDGVPQVILAKGTGAVSVALADGKTLWEHAWPGDGIVQPALTADGGVLLGSGSGLNGANGVRRLAVTHDAAGWGVTERWTSAGLKPYFSDFVVHKGHAFGFDGSILACIDLQDGARRWKGGRYGHGQVVLLSDQDVLLVVTEEGELALVKATPEGFSELARIRAIEGKTWNHPVVAGDILLVRNGEEMVAFRLPLANP